MKIIELITQDTYMNMSKNIYTFMLAVLIVMSGCIGAGTGDANQESGDSGDEAATTTVINNYYNNTTLDEPEWFSQGGIVDVEYNGYHDVMNHTGQNLSGYNTTECFNLWGTPSVISGGSSVLPLPGMDTSEYSIVCDIYLTTITTQRGEMLVIHEYSGDGLTLNTTCQGETETGVGVYGDELRARGHAMNCTHELFIGEVLPQDASEYFDEEKRTRVLWSIAYSIREVTVV